MLLKQEKLDSILFIDDFDFFYYDLEDCFEELVWIINMFYVNECEFMVVDIFWFFYFSDVLGIYNWVLGYFEEYIYYYDQLI